MFKAFLFAIVLVSSAAIVGASPAVADGYGTITAENAVLVNPTTLDIRVTVGNCCVYWPSLVVRIFQGGEKHQVSGYGFVNTVNPDGLEHSTYVYTVRVTLESGGKAFHPGKALFRGDLISGGPVDTTEVEQNIRIVKK